MQENEWELDMEVEMRANAKINLALDVLGEREDGFHEVDMILQEIDLADTLSIEEGRGGFALTCDDPSLALDRNNLIFKAWEAMKDRVEDNAVVIELEKRIPIQAGLGGGSSDAAATLKGLNKLWDLDLSDDELEEIGAGLGSDVPFFIRGGTQRGRGRGEILTPLRNWYGHHVLLVNPGEGLSTAYVYGQVENYGKIPLEELAHAIDSNAGHVSDLMQNQLETVTLTLQPKLRQIKKELKDLGADMAMVSGSGPTVFGLFEDEGMLKKARRMMESAYPFVYLASTL